MKYLAVSVLVTVFMFVAKTIASIPVSFVFGATSVLMSFLILDSD